MTRLFNKVALITGGGAGIGAAPALLFCREGAAVTLVDADAQALEKPPGPFMWMVLAGHHSSTHSFHFR